MERLYFAEPVQLGKDDAPKETFDSQIFTDAAEWIRKKGKFTPDMLAEAPALRVINETYRILQTAIDASIDEQVPDDLVGALENNTFIFSGLKTYHSLKEVGLSLVDEEGKIKPFDAFSDDVAKIDATYNRNYLNAEYNHAVTSSQMAVKWHDFERDGDRYLLQYRTAGDALVRPSHQALDKITLSVNDPFWDAYLPPNGWRCRCTVVQVRRGKYTTSDSSQSLATGNEVTDAPKDRLFRFNPGKELKIYPDKHPYNKAPKAVKDVVNGLADDRAKNKDDAGK